MKIEGRNAVYEILQSENSVDKILASKTGKEPSFNRVISLAKDKKVKIQFVSNEILNHESVTGNHQGIIAYTSDFKYSTIDEILNSKTDKGNFIVILDGVEDPHNFGSIIRVCECLGVDGIIISKNRACPVNETVIRTSAGAIAHTKIAKVTNINQTIEDLKETGIWVYGIELGGEKLANADFTGNIALVLGSEGNGIAKQTLKNCDKVYTIEMAGKVNSLNVSVSTGIAVYEAFKQRI